MFGKKPAPKHSKANHAKRLAAKRGVLGEIGKYARGGMAKEMASRHAPAPKPVMPPKEEALEGEKPGAESDLDLDNLDPATLQALLKHLDGG